MTYNKTTLATLCALSASTSVFADQNINHGIAYNGFTGIFNTPTAVVIDKGNIDIGYSNQLEARGKYTDGHNFTFSAGLFEGLEVSGRITSSSMHDITFSYENKGQIRDLSFNAKYQIPFIPKDWFSVAVGAKDFGGAANQYEAFYAVASKQWWDFRFSAGIGASDTLTGQLDGAFAGIEYQPYTWLSVLAEHDAEAFNLGARITVPKEWLYDIATVSFNSRFYSNTELASDDTYWGVNISMPLSDEAQDNYHNLKPAPQPVAAAKLSKSSNQRTRATLATSPNQTEESVSRVVSAEPVKVLTATKQNQQVSTAQNNNQQIHSLKSSLVNDGFENIRVGISESKQIIVEFENSVFNRNEIDALGLVLGRITESFATGNNEFIVRLAKQDIPLLQVNGYLDNYRRFIDENITPDLMVSTQFSDKDAVGVKWAGNTQSTSPYFVPRVSFSPSLSSRYATELGVYDYSLALQADLHVPLWQGAGVNITGQVNVANTDHFEKGSVFSNSRQETGIKRAVVYQTFALPFNIYNQTQVGLFQDYFDYTGITNETAWQSPAGRHKIQAKLGYFEYKDYDTDKRDYSVYSYRYLWAEKDVSFHISGGQFWNEDTGYKLETKFWFGDANITVMYSDTDVEKVGIGFSIPLSPRKDMDAGNWQVTGTKSWTHSVNTIINQKVNLINTSSATILKSSIDLDNTFLNQDRMSSSYVYAHLARLKEAFEIYK
ncbi:MULTISPECIES: YjbH domain-containing protein [Pseudoalteromonas]|uniref:YjbH domain-containing protein n=1 Tax=Pseudoalteromonas TaxID=53246 RepID=UPI00123133CB|nr:MULTISPECIES: YjbH domain-containing protein [Pseudoalteromonas]MBB1416522.1 YjbH domain-containing protein [Pseudoalteromonas sp. SG44-1]MBB1433320.1 YjbH domain-containing protein [Pseudoalteromonas sp. SG43-6]MBB1478590.1 YjbH domain-containing protein [Pseudoalteromonas sp. SG41-2]